MGKSKEITFNTIGTITSLFCQWLIILVIPKIHDFEDAGVFTVSISIASILYFVASLSLREHQVADQHTQFSHADYAHLRRLTTLLSFACLIPFIFLFQYDLVQTLAILSYLAYRNILNYSNLYAASLQIESKLDYVGKCAMAEGVVSFTSFVSVYIITSNLVLAIAAMAALGGGLYYLLLRHGFRTYTEDSVRTAPHDRERMKILASVGMLLMFSSIVPNIINALPKLFLQEFHGYTLAGIFGTISAPAILIPTMVTGLTAPYIVCLANLVKDGQLTAFRKTVIKILGAILGIGAAFLLIAFPLQDPAFQILYGSSIDGYIPYFSLLIVAVTLYSAGSFAVIVLITKHQWRVTAICSLIALMSSMSITYSLTASNDFSGATYSLIYSFGIYSVLNIVAAVGIPFTEAIATK